ncbi:hypothetical protein [Streptococcus fryi]
MKLDKAQELEKLEEFIFSIDDLLEEITEKAMNQGYKLDLSMDSLGDFAKYIRNNGIQNTKEHMIDFINCWVYLGEVFRLKVPDSEWTVGLENPRNINYGLYFLTGFDENGSEFIPILYVNNFTKKVMDATDEIFFSRLIDGVVNPKPINLDYLPTEK